ncbi:MAG: hypothetical protein AB8B69_21925 [Chitinophagales bacterium]
MWIDEEFFLLDKDDYSDMVEKTVELIDVFIQRSGALLNDLLGIESGEVLSEAMIYK